ncbi:glycosyl hydrolase 115 family protein [Flavobacterium daemonense]|uniref:glycosyl hydrolase 115 family protein n=1 Tax=Flavobacterium daemonense TaxID=1393049 RepID=UPI001185092B|nr:glycosyl hydrolase 115 family protein [Flavobacterium daemonense]KAF2327741.1 glycosyl hydrolase [Flavobacterium daemonense]
MKKILLLIFSISSINVFCQSKNTSDFVIADSNHAVNIFIDKNTDPLIIWAVNELADDVKELTGKRPEIIQTTAFSKSGIYIGEVSNALFKARKEQKELLNQWEKFSIKKEKESLIIAGSDVRGTVYAIFEMSDRLGISPWKWWADVHPIKQEKLVLKLSEQQIISSPSVQYRGIFLNDEDWALQPWAAKTFEPETGDIGPKTYEKIFQLLLRLKANTIWPAMHPSTKGFFTIAGNKEMAQKYHIVIGSSHAEPMLRNNVDEWKPKIYGDYNYFTNKTQVDKYWQDRLDELKFAQNETIMTLGMRGVHDSKMEGAKDLNESISMVEKIIVNQREMLANTFKKPLAEIPQAFVPYKEVLELYDNGLKVPSDITLIWPDDNYGYIRRLSNEEEQKRVGGSGVYYHISYWGRPHDYLWLSTMQPGLIWYEMNKAYQNGAKKMWIVNVGDIKPAEFDTELFLDMAWNINSIKSDGLNQYLREWASREFSPKISTEVGTVFEEYYRLAFLRKPEYMGWSQTEPTTQVKLSDFSEKEIWNRIKAYNSLVEKIDSLSAFIPQERKDAWFQLAVYPVKGAAYMNGKFLYWNLAAMTSDEKEKAKYELLASESFHKIEALTDFYNTKLSGGKWNKMMSMHPRNLPVFDSVKEPETVLKEQKQTANRIAIQAKDFTYQKGFKNYSWKTINGLGYSNNAVTLFPLKQQYFKTEKPFVTYEFEIKTSGEYEVELRILPTHSNNFDHEVGIQIDQNSAQFLKTNTKDREKTWKENVLRNSAIVRIPVLHLEIGKHKIKIEVNQTGIVLDQLAVYPSSEGSSYEIPLK